MSARSASATLTRNGRIAVPLVSPAADVDDETPSVFASDAATPTRCSHANETARHVIALKAINPLRNITRWVSSIGWLHAVLLRTHETRRAWLDLLHEGIEDTFVSDRSHAHGHRNACRCDRRLTSRGALQTRVAAADARNMFWVYRAIPSSNRSHSGAVLRSRLTVDDAAFSSRAAVTASRR